jgi:hypothetical protein
MMCDWSFSFGRFSKISKRDYGLRFVCLSVSPSVRMVQLGSQWKDFYQILYLSIFRKSVEKIKFSLKSDKKNGHFAWRPMYIYENISLHSS